jgi:F-type H+-transporting ATPase subunit c
MEDGIFYVKAAAFVAAGLCMALGSFGPSIGQGLVGMKACENIGKYPENSNNIRMAMLLALAAIETSSIYCLVISFFLILLNK